MSDVQRPFAPAQLQEDSKMSSLKCDQTEEEYYKDRLVENINHIHSMTRLKQLIIITEKMMRRELDSAKKG